MTPKELIDAFEVLADAPEGVDRLRELVLQLAVQGKLVPQDTNDEPASEVLESIAAEKARLVRRKKIKKPKPLPPVDFDEMPLELPEGWEWARLEEVSTIVHYGYTASADFEDVATRLLRITDIQDNKVNWPTVPGCRIEPGKIDQYALADGDIVIARTGGTVGKSYLVSGLNGFVAVFASYLIRVGVPESMSSSYLKVTLETPLYWSQLREKAVGTGQPNVNATSLKGLCLPIAPLAEQHRIVARVDELMALLDRLEAAQGSREGTRQALRDAALSALRDADDPETVQLAWTRIVNKMENLFTDPIDILPLRRTILQLAVRGRLVPQDADDEAASLLLDCIAAEKAGLVKEKKIKKAKPLPPIEPRDVPFEVPRGWEWSRLGQMLLGVEAGWSPSAQQRSKEGSEWGVLKVSACSWGEFLPEENKALDPGTEPRKQHEVTTGDFLISRANTVELVARSVVVKDTPPRLMLSDKTLRLHPSSFADVNFLNLANLSDSSREHYAACATGTSDSMRNVSQEAIRAVPLPVPPPAEQQRIVAKVSELMAMCDDLEAFLKRAQGTCAVFAASAVGSMYE